MFSKDSFENCQFKFTIIPAKGGWGGGGVEKEKTKGFSILTLSLTFHLWKSAIKFRKEVCVDAIFMASDTIELKISQFNGAQISNLLGLPELRTTRLGWL